MTASSQVWRLRSYCEASASAEAMAALALASAALADNCQSSAMAWLERTASTRRVWSCMVEVEKYYTERFVKDNEIWVLNIWKTFGWE